MHVCVYMFVCLGICVWLYNMCLFVCVYVCMYECVCMHMFIYVMARCTTYILRGGKRVLTVKDIKLYGRGMLTIIQFPCVILACNMYMPYTMETIVN